MRIRAALLWGLVAALGFSLLSLALATLLGSQELTLVQWWRALIDPEAAGHAVIWRLRLPRGLAAWQVGAMLALAGCLMQVLLRNPLADPYVLGVSGGAACFALAGGVLGWTLVPRPVLAFAGALTSMVVVFVLGHGRGAWRATRLLLTGVVVAAAWGALISLLLALTPEHTLRGMLFWLMGDLTWSEPSLAVGVVLALALALTWFKARALNVMLGGEIHTMLLGESSQRLNWLLYLLGSLLAAGAVSIAGTVGFVGLVVPHMTRLLVGPDNRVLLPVATVFGGGFLVLADVLARTVAAPQQLPVGVITALVGAPLFLLLLHRARTL